MGGSASYRTADLVDTEGALRCLEVAMRVRMEEEVQQGQTLEN